MLNNYTRTAWRSLSKNRVFALINILGLSAAHLFNNDGLRQLDVGDKKIVEGGMYFADLTVFDILINPAISLKDE